MPLQVDTSEPLLRPSQLTALVRAVRDASGHDEHRWTEVVEVVAAGDTVAERRDQQRRAVPVRPGEGLLQSVQDLFPGRVVQQPPVRQRRQARTQLGVGQHRVQLGRQIREEAQPRHHRTLRADHQHPLAQVTRYLADPAIRAHAISQVSHHLDPNTRAVIGHSLGSVVAYETLRTRPAGPPLPLLVTLGSPLGLSAINRRLQQPPAYPTAVSRWVNLAAPDDIVAARPDLLPVFDHNRPGHARFDPPGKSTTAPNPTAPASTSPNAAADKPSPTPSTSPTPR